MSPLHRHARHSSSSDLRRIVAVVAVAAVLSVAWHAIRDRVLVALASSSIGCRGREGLIEAAMRVRNPSLPADAQFLGMRHDHTAAVIVRSTVPMMHNVGAPDPNGLHVGLTTVADTEFRVRGRFVGEVTSFLPPVDLDGDGEWEVAAFVFPSDASKWYCSYLLVLSLGDRSNKIAFLAQFKPPSAALHQAAWARCPTSGGLELHFLALQPGPMTGGMRKWESSHPVAIFAPDVAGVLRARLAPPSDLMVVWSSPDGQPPEISQLAWLEAEARQRLPLPVAPALTTQSGADPP